MMPLVVTAGVVIMGAGAATTVYGAFTTREDFEKDMKALKNIINEFKLTTEPVSEEESEINEH